ncbi:hypothetical protein PIB30_044220 [Stylosanthes scabra]|uniref:F-box domain-containing protein n=1 Tax=Stylosanthes scabra TaxID=79078 RepID=A0ABU6UHM1_9FABA|nr:hypothetical protein [Stylosanthes scabra]
MSVFLHHGNNMPSLGKDLLEEIFLHLDAPSILSCRATCRYWHQKLTSYEFLLALAQRWLARGSHIILHFGFSPTEQLSVEWIMKIDPFTGEAFPFHFPFTITQRGWFDIIGVENGLFYLRYCEDGRESQITVWNPATGQRQELDDPLQHHCADCAYYYALAYFPASAKYAVVHISNDHDNNAPAMELCIGSPMVAMEKVKSLYT